MPRATPNQLNAEITKEQFDALEAAIKRKYGNGRGKRAQFIREAVAAAVREQGIQWIDNIQPRKEWKSKEE